MAYNISFQETHNNGAHNYQMDPLQKHVFQYFVHMRLFAKLADTRPIKDSLTPLHILFNYTIRVSSL